MESLIKKYQDLKLNEVVNFEKFNLIAISHHSTKIEGSTLTELEVQILLDNGLTPKGKSINDTLMVQDHFKAIQFVINEAKNQKPITVELIQKINSLVLANTGTVYNTIFGEIDSTKGMFRKGNVTAGTGSYFPNYDKVETLTNKVVEKINDIMKENLSIQDKINLSFDAHFNLVSVHPFYDGNGRTSRLLMNYIQAYYDLPLAIINSQDRDIYFQALIDTREKDDINYFRNFMKEQYGNHLKTEIEKFQNDINPSKNRGFHFLF